MEFEVELDPLLGPVPLVLLEPFEELVPFCLLFLDLVSAASEQN